MQAVQGNYSNVQYSQTYFTASASGIQNSSDGNEKAFQVSYKQGEINLLGARGTQGTGGTGYAGYNENGAAVRGASLAYESFQVSYQNKEGDVVQLNYARAEMEQNIVKYAVAPSNTQGLLPSESTSLQQIIEETKSILLAAKELIIKNFIESAGGEYKEIGGEDDELSVEELEAKMPEYWNAENTSQRIVEFATAFFGQFGEGDVDAFLEKIKGAIGSGFDQAKAEIGTVSDPVSGLTQKTYNMVMQKLDAWAETAKTGTTESVEALI